MKVLHLTPQVPPEVGGIGTFTWALVNGLTALGHSNTVISSHGRLQSPDRSTRDDVEVHLIPYYAALTERSPLGLLQCKRRTAAIKREVSPDIVHLHLGGPMAALHLMTKDDSAAPLVVTVYDLPEGDSSPTIRQALGDAARIVAISEIRRAEVDQLVPGAQARTSRIYPSGPVDVPSNVDRDSSPLIFTCGRLVQEKGFDVAIDALALVREARPDARLVIAGDGPVASELEAAIARHGLVDSVTLTGRVTPAELGVWQRRAWVTLLLSRHSESFGLVALEAMQAARPVIATRVGGVSEVVEDGITGVLVPSGDARAVADAVLAIVGDERSAAVMGLAGRARAQELFEWQTCLAAYDRVYRAAVGG